MSVPRSLQSDNQVQYAINASLTVPLYSLMYMEVDDVRPAASISDQGTEEANQRYFASRFVGVGSQSRVSTDPAETKYGVYREFVGDFDCVSGTFEVGDLVGVDEDAGGTFLTNDRLVKVTDPSLAIGEVIERVASAATTVRVRLGARAGSVAGNPVAAALSLVGGLMGNGLTNTETLSGNKTIATGDPTMQVIDPTAARDLTLPDVAANAGRHFIIRNAADAAEVITIKNAAAATICTPTQNETAIVWSNGTTWFGITGFHN